MIDRLNTHYILFFQSDIDEARVEKSIRTLLEVTTDLSPYDQINHFIQYGQNYEGVFLFMFRALVENISLGIPKDFRNKLVSNAFSEGQERSGIKISMCNVLDLPPDSPVGDYQKIIFWSIIFLNVISYLTFM